MSDSTGVKVQINDGKLLGCYGKDLFGNPFLKFLGVPYAKPPVADMRFKAPEPVEPWEGIKDARVIGNTSVQKDILTREIKGSEDCLHLNVYTHELHQDGGPLKPVMVYIHAGGFMTGCNSPLECGPEFLMTEDIVMVTINYRLGLLGFLSLEDPTFDIPGNNGLKDQTLALKWVKNNIRHFNGDPDNITIFGVSAGATSVEFHQLSPASKGLFHKAIIQSGSVFNSWSWGRKWKAMKLMKVLGKNPQNEREAYELLRNATVEEILAIQGKLPDALVGSCKRSFSPVIEIPNENAFITEDPNAIYSSNSFSDVPTIFGFASKEGMFLEFEKSVGVKVNDIIKDCIPWNLTNVEQENGHYKGLNEKFKELYNGCKTLDDKYNLYTDSVFVAGIARSLGYHINASGSSPKYLYMFNMESSLNSLKQLLKLHDNVGACHADDSGYIFKSYFTPETLTENEEKLVKKVVKLWTNFAKHGNPSITEEIEWKPVTSLDRQDFLDMSNNCSMDVNPNRDRLQAWKNIYDMYPPRWIN